MILSSSNKMAKKLKGDKGEMKHPLKIKI